MSRVFRGSTDAAVFEDFVDELLRHCGRWPEPKSVLVMDNCIVSPLRADFADVC
jgi:hypothetical protein